MRNFFLTKFKSMIKERIQTLIKELGISGREFCKNIGQSDSWNRTIGKSIGTDIVVNILTTYPTVSLKWLVLGEGHIFTDERTGIVKESPKELSFNKDYEALFKEMREDNRELRKENKDLRDTILELMYKNEQLMIENVQLRAKSVEES